MQSLPSVKNEGDLRQICFFYKIFFSKRIAFQHQNTPWSPLSAGQNRLFENETLIDIAKSHNKTVAQIVLRWLIQRGIVPIVKSSNLNRMKENIDVFDFELSSEEMQMIFALDTGHTCFSPRTTREAVDDFLKKSLLYNI